MSTRAIRTSIDQASCDVCGRTLLRGERSEVYLGGGGRHNVCELCTSRALHDGWVREGDALEYDSSSRRPDRRRSLFGRLRGRGREESARHPLADEPEPAFEPGVVADADVAFDGSDGAWDEEPRAPASPPRPAATPARAPGRLRRRATAADRADGDGRGRSGPREPRHVRAVPTSVENKISSAATLFNGSEHPRTVAGIARSLGLPEVSVHPSDTNGSVVHLVVLWELCWYRYEVDLSDEVPQVRLAAQGYELSELSEAEREINTRCDEQGRLAG